jgi:hypothetical protein
VHAAKHGLAHPKWRLDVAAVADHGSLESLRVRARAHGLGRAVEAVLAAVQARPVALGRMEPDLGTRLLEWLLREHASVVMPARPSRLERYLLELLLEESDSARLRMGLGYLEGRVRSLRRT